MAKSGVNSREERIGIVRKNKYESLMRIIDYKDANNMMVEFDEGYQTHVSWFAFCRGEVRNVYDKSVFGVGYLGEGKHKASEKGKVSSTYKVWRGMLTRCYDFHYHEKFPTYIGCTVAEEWHNFQTFAAWYDENYYEIEGQDMQLDKDILVKRNKVYSPNTCIFVPARINGLFIKSNKNRGTLPIGVFVHKKSKNKYSSQLYRKYIGSFNTIEDAFLAYKLHKEDLIKQIAEEYKEKTPDILYKALISYQVDIDD